MKNIDVQDFIQRYETRLQQYGYDPQTLGWGKKGRQEVRFSVLAEEALTMPTCSILDVGCGFADLYDFLSNMGWKGTYTGVDIVPGLLRVARERRPSVDVRLVDITSESQRLERYDYVIGSGVMNAKLPSGENPLQTQRLLQAMFELANKAVCVDFMTTLVDFKNEAGWHTDPAWAISEAMKLSNKFKVRHDYMPFEFALFIYKDTGISHRNVFNSYEDQIQKLFPKHDRP